jgi:hypothetical protein
MMRHSNATAQPGQCWWWTTKTDRQSHFLQDLTSNGKRVEEWVKTASPQGYFAVWTILIVEDSLDGTEYLSIFFMWHAA